MSCRNKHPNTYRKGTFVQQRPLWSNNENWIFLQNLYGKIKHVGHRTKVVGPSFISYLLTLSTSLWRSWKSLFRDPVDFLSFRKTNGDRGWLDIMRPGTSTKPANYSLGERSMKVLHVITTQVILTNHFRWIRTCKKNNNNRTVD